MNANIDKEEMRAYLLGTLDADRRAQFEERLSEPEIYEELRAVEVELIDEFVRGELSELDQQAFKDHVAITAEGRKKIRQSTLLKRYADAHPAPFEHRRRKVTQVETTAPAKRRLSFLLPLTRRPLLASVAVLMAGLAILTLCWLIPKKAAEQQALLQGESRMIEATLVPGDRSRGEGKTQRVSVPPEGPFEVKLRLEVTNASFANYRSQLLRESKSLLTKDHLKIEASGKQPVVPVVIAGELLSPGDYQLILSGVLDSGADEVIDNYSFRITTE